VLVAEDADPEKKAEARKKIDKAREELVAGKPFAEVTREYSEDNIASAGGDLGYIKKGYMPPEFDKVAFALEKNKLSEVVETKFGYHLVEVLDQKPAGIPPYEEVKDFIAKFLKMEASKKKRQSVIQALRAEAKVATVNPE
jgi:parvulin-like peptidyl-prolyl isomerase